MSAGSSTINEVTVKYGSAELYTIRFFNTPMGTFPYMNGIVKYKFKIQNTLSHEGILKAVQYSDFNPDITERLLSVIFIERFGKISSFKIYYGDETSYHFFCEREIVVLTKEGLRFKSISSDSAPFMLFSNPQLFPFIQGGICEFQSSIVLA